MTIQEDNKDATMIIGDLNQQRQEDYAKEEWRVIRANKKRRDSPEDDWVASPRGWISLCL